MISITLQSLCRILLDNKQTFTIERSDAWQNEPVIKFVVANYYPIQPCHIFGGEQEDREKAAEDKYLQKNARIALHYHMDKQSILSSCFDWYTLIGNAISQAKKTRINKDVFNG